MSSAVPAGTSLSIGEVLAQLRPDFPDVTISKIRFLESEGLVEPRRTPSGYRKFGHGDVKRLRFVLTAQRDHYLPLRVIKEHLDALDHGRVPPGPAGLRALRARSDAAAGPGTDPWSLDAGETRWTRAELAAAAGLSERWLAELEEFGLLVPRGGRYGGDALRAVRVVAELAAFGIEPRHLWPFRTAAERQAGLVEQVVTPLRRQRGADSRARAEESTKELAALCVRLHEALLQAALRPGLQG